MEPLETVALFVVATRATDGDNCKRRQDMTSRSRAAKVLVLTMVLMAATACNDKYKTAATYIQKYANTLQAFQKAEIAAHGDKFVTDDEHIKVQSLFIPAAHAGKDLDAGLILALHGGNPQAYIDSGYSTLDSLLDDGVIPIKNETKRAEFKLILESARAILTDAAGLIK